jgi:P27 family predicted phage terminase small subunit
MAGKGPPPKPTALKVVAGTDRPCRTNAAEPKPPRGRPSPPVHISDKARTAWAYVTVILDQMGVLTDADALAVEGLCEAYADVQAARAALAARDGALTYETQTKAGGRMVRAYPEMAMLADADRRLMAWMSRFGLTPADRSRVSMAPQTGGNKFAEFG